jgi:hypothetical protein
VRAGTPPFYRLRAGADRPLPKKTGAARSARSCPLLPNPATTTQSRSLAQADNKPAFKADSKDAGAVAGCPGQPCLPVNRS